jgi:hypothetical protein
VAAALNRPGTQPWRAGHAWEGTCVAAWTCGRTRARVGLDHGEGTGMTRGSRLSTAAGASEGVVGWRRSLGRLGRATVLGCSGER